MSSHNCGYDNISSKFGFQAPGFKVRDDITTIFYHVWSDLSQPENLNVYNIVP